MDKLVSVVIPSYGGGEFLKRAVDSVLSQTYKNFEVIVVDDNGLGTDNQLRTGEVMKEYFSNPKVKYVCHDVNRNGSAARNTGVKKASGDFVCLLDDDDAFFPETLQLHIDTFSHLSEEYAMTFCGTDYFIGDKRVKVVIPHKDGSILKDVLMQKIVIGSSTMCIRRNAYNSIGGFDESFRRHQDLEFAARLCARYKVKAIEKIGRRKYIERRNSAKSPEMAKVFRLHYLNKMQPLIELFPQSVQKDIVVANMVPVAIEFFKKYGLKSFVKEYNEFKPGFRGLFFLFKRIWIIVKRGRLRL